MKKIFYIFLLLCSINAAELNRTLIEDTNITKKYENLILEIEKSKNPEAKLQKTLALKILHIEKEGIKPFLLKEKEINNQKSFIENFLDIIEKREFAKKYELSIDAIKEQLDEIKKNILKSESNATNLLTLQLEYAYYYKKLEKIKKDIENVDKNFKNWIFSLYPYIKKIEFKKIEDKTLDKKIENIEKRVKKLNIEKERWEILQKKAYVKNIEKELNRLYFLKDKFLFKKIENRLSMFFYHLKRKNEKIFKIEKEMLLIASKLSKNRRFFKDSLKEGLDIFIEKRFGKTKSYLYKIKEESLKFLTTNTFFKIPLYKFTGALAIFLIFLFFRKIFALVILKILKQLASKTKTHIDDDILKIVAEPLKFSFIIIGFYLAVVFMDLENEIVDKIVKSMVIFAIFWIFYDAIAVLEEAIFEFAKKFGKELYREIGNFFIKTLKIFIFAVGAVAILQEWNINVSAFIASLGLGGLAFALAAKDTAANLFGGLTILADKSLKIDDWISVDGVEGTVEDIGLRTIKVRTFEKSLVTVPNQIVANSPIENFSRRDIRRIKMRIGLTYDTTKEQMDKILEEIRNLLKSHPGIDKNSTIIVNFDQFEDSSLSIFIYCFTNSANWQKYLNTKEDINLKIMDIVEKTGASFAFPSQSIYIEKLPKTEER